MFAKCASSFVRASSRVPVKVASEVTRRSMAKLSDAQTAGCAWKKSCYNGIDYTIGDECTVFEGERMVCMRVGHLIYAHLTLSFLIFCEAIQKLAAYDVGCLVTTDANGE